MGKVFNALHRAATAAPSEETTDNRPEKALAGQPERNPWQEEPPDTTPERLAATGRWDDRLVQATAVTGPVAESIRSLRTRILLPASGRRPRSLLVTSASPQEGKSFICANLGISLAQGVDNHCLLVDCDLRRPAQHVLFGLGNRAGLSDYLQHRKTIHELLLPSGVDKLSLLPAGPRSINPAELLGSTTMSLLVEELVTRYDDRIILFDSPPLHAASETAILAQQVDAVVLVVRSGASRREYVKTLVEAIGRDKIVGVVFNAFTANMIDTTVFGYYEYQRDPYGSEK